MTHWLFQEVTLPLGELLFYIWLAIILAVIGTIGWAAFYNEKKKASTKIITHPFNSEQNNSDNIANNQKDKSSS
ncbi:hypothetical protein ACFLUY_01950 [Chloroflexota bacterium]